MCFLTTSALDSALKIALEGPWEIQTDTEFYTLFAPVVSGCAISFTLVEPTRGDTTKLSAIVNGCVGIVMCTVDKLLILLVLLFSAECGLRDRLRGYSDCEMMAYGLPAQILRFFTAIDRHATTHTASYYGNPNQYAIARVDEWADEPD
jgi:hypothetical protein